MRYPEPGEEYPGQENGYCLKCHWPITPDGDCNCGWNHRTKQSAFNEHAHFFLNQKVELISPLPQEKKEPEKNK